MVKKQPANPTTFTTTERATWRPPENLLPSEWVEKYRELPAVSTAEPGPFRWARVPFLRDILDRLADPYCAEVVFCKAAQIGGTTLFESALGYVADQDPGPAMLFLADEETAAHLMRTRIHPMFRGSPRLAPLIVDARFNLGEMSLANGFSLETGWGSSVSKSASRSVRYLFLDEVDKPGYQRVGEEGSALHRLRQRTETFANKKIYLASTPTIESGNISAELATCDVVYDWHVPCPRCGCFQPLRWSPTEYRDLAGDKKMSGSVVWDGGGNATADQIATTARYECGECRARWSSLEKNRAVAVGKWAPRAPEPARPAKVGYHASRLLSLFPGGRLEVLVADWIGAQETPAKLQSFLNSVLAEPWVPRVTKQTESDLAAAIVPTLARGVVPDAALAITIGIDSQLTGFPWVCYAWMRDRSGWLVDHGVADSRQQLEELLFRREWKRQNGQPIRLWRAALDCGGGRQAGDLIGLTEQNYRWLAQHGRAHGIPIWGVRGSPRPMASPIKFNAPLQKTPSGRRVAGGLVIVDIDTAVAKLELHQRWQWARTLEPGAVHFHNEADDKLFRQLLAEELRETRQGGQEWVPIRRDNHWLDASVYAISLCFIEFLGGILRIPDQAPPDPVPLVAQTAPPPQPPAGVAPPHHRITKTGINPWLAGRPNPFGPRR